jgi:hypothetical protein
VDKYRTDEGVSRYFGSELERVIEAPIALSWPDPFRLRAKIDDEESWTGRSNSTRAS